jgi:pyruvate ferredoxin oxidoreductase gamma subunit
LGKGSAGDFAAIAAEASFVEAAMNVEQRLIRVRFHGRGGHGVKTASRILGTAAFLAGRNCQDSPVYGAERRGAAVMAFTRISQGPILERGVITEPDLIVLADETLFDDPSAGVLAGQEHASGLFVNSSSSASLTGKYAIHPAVFADDLTGRTLAKLGRASALSAGLGAAAARLTGVVSEDQLMEALRQEFEHLAVASAEIEKNAEIAHEVFTALPVMSFREPVLPHVSGLSPVLYDRPLRGAPSVLHAGNAAERRTGTWRVERPIVNPSVCTRCGLCQVVCPDGAIALDAEGYPVIDYDHCKGCMICRQVCPLDAIRGERETRAW